MITRILLSVLMIVAMISGAGVVSAEAPGDYDACNNPNEGLLTSAAASSGASLNAWFGVTNALETVGCDDPQIPD